MGPEGVVDEQRPDIVETHPADQVIDVDTAIPQSTAVLVGLGDGGVERDDAFQTGDERRFVLESLGFGHCGHFRHLHFEGRRQLTEVNVRSIEQRK